MIEQINIEASQANLSGSQKEQLKYLTEFL